MMRKYRNTMWGKLLKKELFLRKTMKKHSSFYFILSPLFMKLKMICPHTRPQRLRMHFFYLVSYVDLAMVRLQMNFEPIST